MTVVKERKQACCTLGGTRRNHWQVTSGTSKWTHMDGVQCVLRNGGGAQRNQGRGDISPPSKDPCSAIPESLEWVEY